MSKIVDVTDIDIFYISFDEPNMEENWANLKNICPWAQRTHGVFGSDAAHKACAEKSNTDRFISVDGDNIVDPKFFDTVIDFTQSDVNLDTSVISWCGVNSINGLVYGNGGIKCWPVQYVLDMKTHEIAEDEGSQVDFCWDLNYIQMNEAYSHVMNNATPYQAYRAGFREGVKMALDQGIKVSKDQFLNGHWKNLHRLWIWLMVGQDVPNGLWAIYGAREGLAMTMLSDWDYVNVRDFEYLNELWAGRDTMPEDVVHEEIYRLGSELQNDLEVPIAVQPLDEDQSKFFKTVYQNPARSSDQQFIDIE